MYRSTFAHLHTDYALPTGPGSRPGRGRIEPIRSRGSLRFANSLLISRLLLNPRRT